MDSLNRLGIRIIGITAVVLLLIFGAWKGITLGISSYQMSRVSQVSPTPLSNIQALPSTTPEPSLTPQQAQELSTLAAKAQQTLVGYTKKYIASLPANSDKNQVLDQKALQEFVEANKGKLLPDLPAGTVKTTTSKGKKAIQKYLDSISPVQNTAIKTVTGDAIIVALEQQQSGEDLEALAPVRSLLEQNFTLFSSVETPKEALDLQIKLLQATQALVTNVKLLQDMRNDIVAGLIGQRNLTDLNAVFTDIATQISALETKYGIK